MLGVGCNRPRTTIWVIIIHVSQLSCVFKARIFQYKCACWWHCRYFNVRNNGAQAVIGRLVHQFSLSVLTEKEIIRKAPMFQPNTPPAARWVDARVSKQCRHTSRFRLRFYGSPSISPLSHWNDIYSIDRLWGGPDKEGQKLREPKVDDSHIWSDRLVNVCCCMFSADKCDSDSSRDTE
jgi:hypothetical protein